ncbi:hypothetical protein JOF28_002218 [Leucobacter exalbidus]|uniref:NfeD-like C-terminal domain-containing protein n=1 Tax=Leucobacter exalbidus TaxID=662960 RepID=A0A940T6G8_9MICO|nr:hypothetical protein [Leucobacter exalbidus]MBP1326986.1 hypothetical protein [Leucobacter exalbidus]
MDGIMNWIERLFDGSLFAGGTFLIIGIVGAVLLLLSLLLDGIFDAFDFGDGPLSLTSIAAFTAIFGFTAFASIGAGVDTPMAAVLGALAGLVGGAAAWWLSRTIHRAESSTAVRGEDLLGDSCSVVLAIPAGGLGEVALTRHGERISLSAAADAPIPRGAAVRIVQLITSTSVRVEAIDPDSSTTTGVEPAPGVTPSHD